MNRYGEFAFKQSMNTNILNAFIYTFHKFRLV